MTVTINILGRTFQISCGTSTGTCFTIDVEDRQYIVTARHVVESVTDHKKILQDETWKNLSIKLVGHGEGDIDISVLATDLQLSPAYPLPTTMDRIALAQDVYFLGFPYGLANDAGYLNRNFHAALVKRAYCLLFGLIMVLESCCWMVTTTLDSPAAQLFSNRSKTNIRS